MITAEGSPEAYSLATFTPARWLVMRDRISPTGHIQWRWIGMAACLYGLVTLSVLEMTMDRGAHVRADPLRLVEAVTQGVAFLAAGLIIFSRGAARGLTTGAGMWLAGAIGLACGLGLWILAGAATALALLVVRLLKILERRVGTRNAQGKDWHDGGR